MPKHASLSREHELNLTPTEYRLLEFLMRRPGAVASRRAIVEAVWGFAARPRKTPWMLSSVSFATSWTTGRSKGCFIRSEALDTVFEEHPLRLVLRRSAASLECLGYSVEQRVRPWTVRLLAGVISLIFSLTRIGFRCNVYVRIAICHLFQIGTSVPFSRNDDSAIVASRIRGSRTSALTEGASHGRFTFR